MVNHRIAAVVSLICSWCATTGVASASPNVIVFEGICDASAAVALDGRHIIVGDDELPWLSVYDIAGGRLQQKIALPDQSAGRRDSGDRLEADIEAATIFGDRVVWISSHSRNENGKVRADRWQLFSSHQLAADGSTWNVSFSPSYHGLLDAILATHHEGYGVLKTAIGDLSKRVPNLAPKKDGFNIEGMAATPDGKTLLIGMRNPTKGGKAQLFPIENAADLLKAGTASATLGRVLALDLEGRGIRDIAWSPANQEYLIIGGQANDDDPGPGFAVFRWTGRDDAKPRPTGAFDDFKQIPHFHPEAIVPLRDAASGQYSKEVLLVSDDGTKPMPQGGVCKDASEAAKSFRAIKVMVP
ncbi:MAG: DUF3616 domain-containing protein [Rhodopila sp.]